MVFSAKKILQVKMKSLLIRFFVTMAGFSIISFIGISIANQAPLYNYWRWVVGGFVTVFVVGFISVLLSMGLYPDIAKKYLGLKTKMSKNK